MLIIAASSTGFQFIYHSCTSSGNSKTAVSFPGVIQDTYQSPIDCSCVASCATEESCSQCESEEVVPHNILNCCKDESTILQLRLEFVVAQELEIDMPTLMLLPYSTIENSLDDQKETKPAPHIVQDELPPKPLYGRRLVTALHQQKIAHA